MMWCKECGQAVEPVTRTEYDIPDANAGGYRAEHISVCPYCHKEVYQEPSCCVMCDCVTAPSENLCDCCLEDIQAYVTLLAEYRNIEEEAVKNGLTEYLNMEDE